MVLESVGDAWKGEEKHHLRMTQNKGFFKRIFHPGVSFFLCSQPSVLINAGCDIAAHQFHAREQPSSFLHG